MCLGRHGSPAPPFPLGPPPSRGKGATRPEPRPPTVPPRSQDIVYAPGYVSEQEERALMHDLACSRSWVAVRGRRLQRVGGEVTERGLVPAPLPSWARALCDRVARDTGVFGGRAPNHVLVNEYEPGQGIMPHQDGPAYHPAVCILSLGAPAVLRFSPKGEGAPVSVVLEPRSLVVFRGRAYGEMLHGIDFVESETVDASTANARQCGLAPGATFARGGTRLSLTVRLVPRVLRALRLDK